MLYGNGDVVPFRGTFETVCLEPPQKIFSALSLFGWAGPINLPILPMPLLRTWFGNGHVVSIQRDLSNCFSGLRSASLQSTFVVSTLAHGKWAQPLPWVFGYQILLPQKEDLIFTAERNSLTVRVSSTKYLLLNCLPLAFPTSRVRKSSLKVWNWQMNPIDSMTAFQDQRWLDFLARAMTCRDSWETQGFEKWSHVRMWRCQYRERVNF